MKSLTVAGLLAAAWAAPAAAQNVGGRYQVQGRNLDGTPYGGVARIEVTSPTTCRIEWQTGTTSTGIWMLSGRVFSAAYRLGNAVDLVIDELRPDGSLDGIRTMADQPGAGSERVVPLR